jgi:biofilm PGA synthesis N-glycosyltransferase PgaC
MFFNPKYHLMGMLSYPYWFFFEFLAPIIECLGIIYFILSFILGLVNFTHFLSLLFMIYSFGVLYSVFAILMEVRTYNQYKEPRDMIRLLLTAILEPIILHPFGVWSAIMGNIDFLRKKSSWGEMTRAGLSGAKK